MKKLIQLLVFAALVATLALPVLAQGTTNTASTAASAQDDTAIKVADYEKFTKNIKTDPAAAYQAGKDYLAKYEAKDGPDDQYIKYIKNWVTKYEKIARHEQLFEQLKNKQVNEAFATAKQVLVDFPDDLGVLFELSRAGTIAATSGNEANNADTINYAKRTIQLLQSGKSFDPSKPLTEKEKNDNIGNLNFALGLLLKKSSPTEAVPYFVNAAQIDSPSKSNPLTYYSLAELYEANEYANLATQFNNNCKTDEQLKTQQCIDMKNKADLVVDHIIDALARAIAYSNAAEFASAKAGATESLTKYYKYRNNNSDAGLKELMAAITSRPFPKPGEAVTPSLYPSAPTTPTTGTTTPGATGATTTPTSTTTTAPKTTTPANTKTGTTTTTTSQPTGKTSSSKTTPKRAH